MTKPGCVIDSAMPTAGRITIETVQVGGAVSPQRLNTVGSFFRIFRKIAFQHVSAVFASSPLENPFPCSELSFIRFRWHKIPLWRGF
jgi:hypothetical protein